ncbi:hypothetical protein B0H14DRAFT_2551636 [Mycena olivaceomarginata]|nr:hypothetical protein B0H14DRAFT_2551636 [Mycena olivaceomarginata]
MNNRGFQIHNHGEAGIHILHRAVALEALYDSAESFPQPRCHPETRTELLDSLYHWATGEHSAHSIRWLHGPAGAGKSAIMQTLCQRLQDEGRLGGSFFFKRGDMTRGNAKVLFATLAYQLALHRHELRGPISQSVEKDPSVLARGMDVQLRTLIVGPCQFLQNPLPSVLLIDGLDECEGHKVQRQILRLIGSTANGHCVQLRTIVASRPESHIRDSFEEESFRGLFDSINIRKSFEDVRTYLRDEFLRIHREHSTTMRNIPVPWPSPQILESLVENSSGHFIYASTVIKFVDDEYSRPSKQLAIIQNLVPPDSESPFAVLDQLYFQILTGVPSRYHPCLCDILSVVLHFPAQIIMKDIDLLLGLEPGQVSLILRPLHSVLNLPSERHEIELHHASFREFLNTQERSSIFYVGSPEHYAKLACQILKELAYRHQDQQKNRTDHGFRWYVEWPRSMYIITSFHAVGDSVKCGLIILLLSHPLQILCPLSDKSIWISCSGLVCRIRMPEKNFWSG